MKLKIRAMKLHLKRSIVLSFIILSLHSIVFSQASTFQNQDFSRWTFGGEFGLGFTSYSANVTVSPLIGYRITPQWEFGTRLTYNYYSYKDLGVKASTNNFGGGFYTIYDIYKGIFAQAENEILSFEQLYWSSPDQLDSERIIIHSIFIGGGYRQFISQNAFASITILYNINETIDSPYVNPLIRIGFGFGF
jgi:hypothetical protein